MLSICKQAISSARISVDRASRDIDIVRAQLALLESEWIHLLVKNKMGLATSASELSTMYDRSRQLVEMVQA